MSLVLLNWLGRQHALGILALVCLLFGPEPIVGQLSISLTFSLFSLAIVISDIQSADMHAISSVGTITARQLYLFSACKTVPPFPSCKTKVIYGLSGHFPVCKVRKYHAGKLGKGVAACLACRILVICYFLLCLFSFRFGSIEATSRSRFVATVVILEGFAYSLA